MLEQAANATYMGLSQFTLQAALRSAEEVLADQTRFVLPADKWDELTTLLDRPARALPALRKAAAEPDDDPQAERSRAYGLRVNPPRLDHPLTERLLR